VAEQLTTLGLRPYVRTMSSKNNWYSQWRTDTSDGMDYAFIYSDLDDSTGKITVQTSKFPYLFDAWSGKQSPIVHYTRTDSTIQIPLTLAANQSVIIGFSDKKDDVASPSEGTIASLPDNVVGYTYEPVSGAVNLHVSQSDTTGNVMLRDGSEVQLRAAAVPKPMKLTHWTLTAEKWAVPEDITDASVVAHKSNITVELPDLVSWLEISELAAVSGVGYYKTSFSWPPESPCHTNSSSLGASISFPPVKHTLRLLVNGNPVSIDYMSPTADISAYLREGHNDVDVVISTPMSNNMEPLLGNITIEGREPRIKVIKEYFEDLIVPNENGLIGEVLLTPYRKKVIPTRR